MESLPKQVNQSKKQMENPLPNSSLQRLARGRSSGKAPKSNASNNRLEKSQKKSQQPRQTGEEEEKGSPSRLSRKDYPVSKDSGTRSGTRAKSIKKQITPMEPNLITPSNGQYGAKFDDMMVKFQKNSKSQHEAEKAAIEEAKKQGGRYGDIRKYAKKELLEADHFPPVEAYKFAKDDKIKKLRSDDMAALILRYEDHRNFSTTTEKDIRQKMNEWFAEGDYYLAIRFNLKL